MQSLAKLKVVSFSVMLSVCVMVCVPVSQAQDNTLPTVTGEVTSPAKNLNKQNTTTTQNINDSGATGQSVTTVRPSNSNGSSGDINITTTNTINGDLTATNGTVVRIGDVNLSGSKTGSVTVRTTTNMKGGDFKDGGIHEFGVVDLMNSELGKVDINTESNLQGNVKMKNNSSVSVGGVNVGNEAKQQAFEQNRGDMAAVSRPNKIAGEAILTIQQQGNLLLNQLENDYKYALMSNCAYSNSRCDFSKLKELGWEIRDIQNPGLFLESIEYRVFINNSTSEVAVSFRGTNIFDFGDHDDNVFRDKSYKNLIRSIAEDVASSNPDYKITFVGHSKGGGEAMIAASFIDRAEAVVFNPRNEGFINGNQTKDLYNSGRLRGYYVTGDILEHTRIDDYYYQLPDPHPGKDFKSEHSMKSVIAGMEIEMERINSSSYRRNYDKNNHSRNFILSKSGARPKNLLK